MDRLKAIRLRALKTVLHPDREYLLRKVMRWYSKTFFTPLAQVEEMPIDDLYQAYYEEHYETLSPEDIEDVKAELLTTEEDRYKQIMLEEADDAEVFEMSKVIAADEQKKALEAKQSKQQKIANVQPQKSGPIVPVEMPETDLPSGPTVIPEGISMQFLDESDFEAELERFETLGQGKKQP